MKISRKLNLLIPLSRDEGTIYVHSTPISQGVFERYYLVIAKTFERIFAQGLGMVAGPRVAGLLLKDAAEELGVWPDVQKGLINEIWRLTNVVLLSDNGWETIPFHEAQAKEYLSTDELSEVENAIAFFTVVSAMLSKAPLEQAMGALAIWHAQPESLNCTEYAASLQTSTPAASSTPATPSSIPY